MRYCCTASNLICETLLSCQLINPRKCIVNLFRWLISFPAAHVKSKYLATTNSAFFTWSSLIKQQRLLLQNLFCLFLIFFLFCWLKNNASGWTESHFLCHNRTLSELGFNYVFWDFSCVCMEPKDSPSPYISLWYFQIFGSHSLNEGYRKN